MKKDHVSCSCSQSFVRALHTANPILLAVTGGILSVAWFDLLKARLAKRPAGP